MLDPDRAAPVGRKRVLDLDPSNFSAHYALGSIYEILGENSRAIDELLKAHRIDSGDERTKQKLERLLIS